MEEKFRTTKIIHLAVTVGLILVYVLLGEFDSIDHLLFPELNQDHLTLIAFPVIAVIAGYVLFNNQLKKIDPQLSIEEKLAPYQTALLIRWALIEAAAFALIVLDPELLIFGILLILYLIALRPTQKRMEKDLKT